MSNLNHVWPAPPPNWKIIRDQVFVGDAVRPADGSDKAAHWIGRDEGRTRHLAYEQYENCIFRANGVAEGLKMTNTEYVRIYGGEIHAGYEDCLDLVNCAYISLHYVKFVLTNKAWFGATIKGESHHVLLDHIYFTGDSPTHWTFVDCGQHSIHYKRGGGWTNHVTVSDCIAEPYALSMARSWRAKNTKVVNTPAPKGLISFQHLNVPAVIWWPWFQTQG